VSTYQQHLSKISPGTLDEANLIYDTALMVWCMQLNREPVLQGNYLKFDSWETFEEYLKSVPEDLHDGKLMEKAVALYEACYEKEKAAGNTKAAVAVGLLMANALDKTGDGDDRMNIVQTECLALAIAEGDWQQAGSFYMAQAHTARFRTYDSKLAFDLLRKAQESFAKANDVAALHHAFHTEMSILDPEANEGKDADLARFQDLYKKCVSYYSAQNEQASLVNLHVFAHEMLVKYQRLDLVELALIDMLGIVKQHFPDEYENNLTGVRENFQNLGINSSKLPK